MEMKMFYPPFTSDFSPFSRFFNIIVKRLADNKIEVPYLQHLAAGVKN
jgi:hypothetical protein